MAKAHDQPQKQSKTTIYRSATTGAFVTQGYAQRHPHTTEAINSQEEVILNGVRQINKATEKQIREIDRINVKYGL